MIRTLTLGLAGLLACAASASENPLVNANPEVAAEGVNIYEEPTHDESKKGNDSGAPDELIGGYTIVSGERYGQKIDADRIEGTTVRFAEDGIVVLDKEKKEVYAQTYKIDKDKKPWAITMKSKITPYTEPADKDKGKDKEHVAEGLIEKDGDTVRLIYALPGGEKPTEFKTKEKQLMFLMKNTHK